MTAIVAAPLKTEIHALFSLIDAFGALLERETKALKQADFKTVDALQPDKRTLAQQYADRVSTLAARKEEAAALELTLRETLVKKRTAFTQILGLNLRALEATKSSARRLVDRILDTAQKTAIDQNHTASWKTATLSLSMDQQL